MKNFDELKKLSPQRSPVNESRWTVFLYFGAVVFCDSGYDVTLLRTGSSRQYNVWPEIPLPGDSERGVSRGKNYTFCMFYSLH